MICEICGTATGDHDRRFHRLDVFAAVNSKLNAATLDKVAELEVKLATAEKERDQWKQVADMKECDAPVWKRLEEIATQLVDDSPIEKAVQAERDRCVGLLRPYVDDRNGGNGTLRAVLDCIRHDRKMP